ncbi:DUF2975 domain-containing protein [Saccharothrix sp. Mg75]|uniref:DUF2975 domain-containing protein n=1 Tax=Saccharothrix sp. Mg75 TaxID=3445357 RepID=UPI003EEE8F95
MFAEHRAVAALRVFLVLLFGVLLLLQVMSLPGQFADMARESPGSAHLRWPLTAVTVFWVLCVQVVVVATWKLLDLVKDDRIFSDHALRWVDAIVWAIAAGWVTFTAVFLFVGFSGGGPGNLLLMFLVLIGITVLGLLMVVMRALLRQATTLRDDLESVI